MSNLSTCNGTWNTTGKDTFAFLQLEMVEPDPIGRIWATCSPLLQSDVIF